MAVSQNNSDKENTSEEKNLENNKLWRFLCKRRSNKIFKIAGIFIICFVLYAIWFVFGETTIDTDYISRLNQVNLPKDYRQEDNAWPHYKKAIELYVEPNAGEEYRVIFSSPQKRFSDFNDAEQKLIIGWVERNEAAWREFTAASLKPYCYIVYKLRETKEEFCPKLDVPTWNIDVGHLNVLRGLSKLGRRRIKLEIERGNIEQALNDCFTLLNAGAQWQQSKFSFEAITGRMLSNLGYEGLLIIISEKNLPVSKFKDVQEHLTNIYASNYPTINFEYDKIFFQDVVQHTFTKGGLGGGHLIPEYLPGVVQAGSIVITMSELETKPTFKEKVLYTAMSLLHARRNKAISKFNEVCEKIEKIKDMTPYERHRANDLIDIKKPNIFNYKINFDSFIKESRYFLIGALIPAAGRLSDMVYENRARHEATITILALERYKIENGYYPETLDELLNKEYIQKIPMDPYSDKPMVYKKIGTDFTLYSVGVNFKDDGGKVACLKWGEPTEEGGDAVFWPVQ